MVKTQLAEGSLPTPEVGGSDPVIAKIKKKGRVWPK